MGKYLVGDLVDTKYGMARIEKVWKLNKQITVFKVMFIRTHTKKEIYYGEINKVLYRG